MAYFLEDQGELSESVALQAVVISDIQETLRGRRTRKEAILDDELNGDDDANSDLLNVPGTSL